jgi:hypothetical protein
MNPILRAAILLALLALVAAPHALAGGPSLLIGATEDATKSTTMAATKAQMDLLVAAGFEADRITEEWAPGQTALPPAGRQVLENVAAAAKLDDVTIVCVVMSHGSATTPLTAEEQQDFASYAASIARAIPSFQVFVVGNEPNLNRYWLPQFNDDGSDAAAPAYESLLAQTYDALKAVSPQINVMGGAVSPRGADRANSSRPTHSPTTFLRDVGAAYRKSRRRRPIMDTLVIHPYGETSRTPPTALHPKSTTISIADYPKLVKLLRAAFHGTAQRGASLPILYGEYGVQTRIPLDKLGSYTNLGSQSATDAISETMQGAYYKRAIQLAYCQPTVTGLLFFHVTDEPDLDRWQSGLFYTDDTPKSNLAVVKSVAQAAQAGTLTCPKPKPKPRRR